MSLATAYKHSHSPIRTQLFWVEMTEIPLFVASQLVRAHVGIEKFQRSKRPDRGGDDFTAQCVDIAERIERFHFDYDSSEVLDECDRVRQLSKHFDRYAPTDLAFICNAETLINIAHKRLCSKASIETRQIIRDLRALVEEADPALAPHLVPQCIYRGVCPEPKGCGYIRSPKGKEARAAYVKLFD